MDTLNKTIVVGGSGFIGKAIQKYVLNQGIKSSFTFTYNKHPEKIEDNLEKIQLNLLDKSSLKLLENFPVAIYLMGNADHGLAKISPAFDLELNTMAFLNFMTHFRGTLILLSSQAVYYGLEKEILEDVDHVPTIPYGISKKMIEAYAKYFLQMNLIHKLWIFRLSYAFGEGEKERRIIPRCAKAFCKKEKVTVFGGGKSFINPLPSIFIAKILIMATETLEKRNNGFLDITNLNYYNKVTVADVVSFLHDLKDFDYEIIESGEEWQVKFWGNTKKLSAYLKERNINFPDIWNDLKTYFTELIKKYEMKEK